MRASTLRTIRFLRTWLWGSDGIEERDLTLEIEDPSDPSSPGFPTSIFQPPGPKHRRPAFVVLHGVTRPGRRHPQLVRFCRALADAGAVAVVPEIREWMELRLAPERTVPAVRAAVDWLQGPDGRGVGPVGLVGFSFGAPQALRAAADPDLRERIAGVLGFGGYCDIHRAVRFQLTGRFQWGSEEGRLDPDPYARWIMAANHLTDIPEHEDADDVARALWTMAAVAGDDRIPADSPVMDDHRRTLRNEIDESRKALFDLLARGPRSHRGRISGSEDVLETPPENAPEARAPDSGTRDGQDRLALLESLAESLSDAALRETPLLEVRPRLKAVRCPVELVHGRHDRLIPYTESLRLSEALPDRVRVNLTITELFSHTEGHPLGATLRAVREGWRFFSTLRRVLGMV